MPEKRVRDLMLALETFSQIPPQQKVADAVEILRDKRRNGLPTFLLVVDALENKEEILGMLSPCSLLDHMESSRKPTEELPIFWQGQFQEECEVIFGRPVSEVMSPVTRVIHETGTLTEAVHLMHLHGIDWLPVVAEKDVVGVVLKEALMDEVFSAKEGPV
jgi:CBS domain-containing protein